MKRDLFHSRWGFIFACIGSAVGMGNIWLFPARVAAYGGGAFLLPYFLFVILIGATGVIGEMAFGRTADAGPVGAFGMATATKGKRGVGEALGLIPTLGSLALAIGYTVVMGWILKYTVGTFTGATLSAENAEGFGAAFGATASAFGNNLWQIIALATAFAILIFGVGKGIEKANKIMMPLFFCLFLGLGIYVLTKPGAFDGYRYIFSVDWSALARPKTWIYALGQAFFSLSIAGGGTLIYGSYLSKKEDVPRSARNVAFFDTVAAMLAALVIIPAMATTGAPLSESGPGLMFIALPHLFKGMPGGGIVAVIFFVAVFFAGLTSLINLYEAPIATLQEKLHLKRLPACLIVAVIGLGISLCIQGIVSDWMDVVSIYICPLGAGIAAVMFFWVLGKRAVADAVNLGRAKPIGKWFYPLSKYVFTGVCLLVLVAGAILGGVG